MANNYQQGAAPDAMSQLKQGLPLALLLSGVVLVLGTIGYFVYSWMSGSEELGPITRSTTAASPEQRVDEIADLMERARQAVGENRIVQPAGNNAVELYLNVLEREPTNRSAREALTEMIAIAIGPAERLVESGDFPESERVLNLLKRADEGSVLVSALRQKLGLAQRAAEQARLTEERRNREQEARAAASAVAATQPTAAPSAADINPLASNPEVAAARTNPAPTTPAPRPAEPAPTTPAPTVATATPPPTAAPALQNRNFELIRRVDPSYPTRALRERIQGWVEIEFTVTTTGDVTDVKVVNAQPRRGDFDREAIRAVQQWKFRPKIENGQAVDATVRQRLNFSLGG